MPHAPDFVPRDDEQEAAAAQAAAADAPAQAQAESAESAGGGEGAGAPTTAEAPVDSAEEAQAQAEGAGAEEVLAGEPEPEPAADEPEPDYKDQYLRALADVENVRKRARRDVGVAEARGTAKLAKELLPALDNLDRALAAAEAEEADTEHHLTKGIRLVQQELAAALTRVGITADSPQGQPFDPHRHEALAQHPVEGTEPGIVVEVYQPGYSYADVVLRPAKVVVSG